MLGDGYSSSEFIGYDQATEMDIALYMSKVIHNDLTIAGVSQVTGLNGCPHGDTKPLLTDFTGTTRWSLWGYRRKKALIKLLHTLGIR